MIPRPLVAVLALALGSFVAAASFAADGPPKTDEEKTLYFLGTLAARNLAPFALSADELAVVQRGMRDALAGNAMDLDGQTYGPRIRELMQSRASAAAAVEKQASQAFLDAEARKPGVRRLESGVLVDELRAGTGDQPTVSDTVVVHYHGTLRDGSVFDSSVERGQPFRTPLAGVVKCWQDGVTTMRVGGKSRLLCPSDVAYGDAGAHTLDHLAATTAASRVASWPCPPPRASSAVTVSTSTSSGALPKRSAT